MNTAPKDSVRPEALSQRARRASQILAKVSAQDRQAAIRHTATLLREEPAVQTILLANQADLDAFSTQTPAPSLALRDRLALDPTRLLRMAKALDEIAALPDPIGEIDRTWRRPNGLGVVKVRIPLGVILIIYEARPNVTTDAAGLCLRSANATILRGGSEAQRSNQAIYAVLNQALRETGLPEDAVLLCPTPDRDYLRDLLKQEQDIDLCIPRGGEGLIGFVSEHARIPVIKHYRGNCHIYVEASAEEDMALAICENAKVQRPGVCNAVETILVDRAIAPRFLPLLSQRLTAAGVELRGDATAQAIVPMRAADEADFHAEFLDLICAVAVVDGLEHAVAHIERYGSNHTEAIVTTNLRQAERFVALVNSSTVLVNASTRFADGGELGLGAEIGISTTRLHAYGPMGAEQLTSTKFVVLGAGQVRL